MGRAPKPNYQVSDGPGDPGLTGSARSLAPDSAPTWGPEAVGRLPGNWERSAASSSAELGNENGLSIEVRITRRMLLLVCIILAAGVGIVVPDGLNVALGMAAQKGWLVFEASTLEGLQVIGEFVSLDPSSWPVS